MLNEDLNLKKDILLDSLEVLKDDVEKYSDILAEIIAKMFAFDKDIAKDMWIYLLDKHQDFVKGKSGNILCDSVILDIEKIISTEELINIIASNNVIKNSIFKLNGYVFIGAVNVIIECIVMGDYVNANEFLELYYQNKNDSSDYTTLTNIILEASEKAQSNNENKMRDYERASRIAERKGDEIKPFESNKDETVQFLYDWSKRINNKSDAAKINVALLKLSK